MKKETAALVAVGVIIYILFMRRKAYAAEVPEDEEKMPSGSKIMECMNRCNAWGMDFAEAFLQSSDIRRCLEGCMPAFFPN